MNARLSAPLRIAAVGTTAAALSLMTCFPALAAGGDVQVVNTETVQIYTDATGAVDTQRIYEQVAMTGSGSVDLRNPIETDGLRNLEGFGGYDVEDGHQVSTVDVDGKRNLRTVSNYKGDLPLDVRVRYFLDGEPVEPGDVVGEDGRLEVRYTVKNVTATEQEITYDDGSGGTVTKTVEVPIPMVGSLTTVAPSNFTDVDSDEANMAGDGRGGTKLSFTMTLFPPIGSDTAEFGYTATITDGVIPRASISALPVNPLESPSFKGGAESYKGGAQTGVELTDGASQIDANLLKLRDGAAELLAGLIQLRDGATQLEAGLAGEAAPGAQRLAAGSAELAGGLGQIDDGAGRLSDGTEALRKGARQLKAGTKAAADGGKKLRDGANTLSGGLDDLETGANDLDKGANKLEVGQRSLLNGLLALEAGIKALPDSVEASVHEDADYQTLIRGLRALVSGIGSSTDVTDPESGEPATLFGALNAIQAGIDGKLVPGLDEMLANIPSSWARLNCGALILTDLTSANPADNAPDACFPASLGSVRPATLGDLTDPLTVGVLRGMASNLEQGRDSLSDNPGSPDLTQKTLHAGLIRVKGGVASVTGTVTKVKGSLRNPTASVDCATASTSASKSDDCGLQQAIEFVERVAIPRLVNGISESIAQRLLEKISVPNVGCDPAAPTLLCGAGALASGGVELAAGTESFVAGAHELDAGGALLATKLAELAAGILKLDAGAGAIGAGAGRLAAGARELASGTGQASDGANQVSDGANQLATGLGDAANGSSRLAGGLRKAAKGAPKLENGAQRLSDEGTSKLVEAGQSTAQNYGEMYATLEAGAKRAQDEDMVYGAPEGAVGLAAYSYEIKGEDGEGGRNLARGLGGAAVLAAGIGAFAMRRRII